jgi:protocatechuate 3,4-dioxygenase beta subunit
VRTPVTTVALVLAIAAYAAAGQAPSQTRSQTPEPRTGTSRIRGTVVDAGTGTPVRRAAIRLRAAPASLGAWTATTDGSGAFDFPALPAGRFSLTATKGGYIALSAGQRLPTDTARPIQVGDGQTVDLPPIYLPRGGVITGRIGDEYGDGVPEVAVQAYRAEYMDGMRRLVSVRSSNTNDIGQYRIYGLQPGTYYVAATARGEDGRPIRFTEPGTQAVRGAGGLAPTFFPGTVAAGEAQRIEVAAGAETAGVDFALQAVRLARISGTIVDSRGRPAGAYAVMLNPARPDGALLLGGAIVAESDGSGRFTLANVPPGDYRLDVRSTAYFEAVAQSGSVGQSQRADAWEFASVPITIAGEDIAGLPVTLTSGYRMTGRVIVDGGTPDPRVLRALRISVTEAIVGISATMLAASVPVAEDGTFEVRGLMGRRYVRVSGLNQWALEGVRAGGLDVTDEGVEIRDGVDDVEVVVTTQPTQLSGVVTDAAGKLVPDAAVIIFPEDRDRRRGPLNRFVTSARTGADGTFRVRALPAATYFAIAVPALADGEWAEPDQLERLVAHAIRFTLAAGESKRLGLKLD